MPDHVALVTALILDRPLCARCIATKSGMRLTVLDQTLATIAAVLVLHRETGRCHACGVTDTVLFLDRPV
jgi:hypothetical protein